MSSQRRIQSSRANGARSRGPKTPEGKARSSRNALKHGLRASILSDEDPAEVEALRNDYTAALHPVGAVECDLVHDLALIRWRLNRAIVIETAMLDDELAGVNQDLSRAGQRLDRPRRMARALNKLVRHWPYDLASRAENRLRRAHLQVLSQFFRLRADRLRGEPQPPETVPATGPQAPLNSHEESVTDEPSPENGHLAPDADSPGETDPDTELFTRADARRAARHQAFVNRWMERYREIAEQCRPKR